MKNKFRLFDYHTQALDHGIRKVLRIEETVDAAMDKGLSAICLTDHFPLPKDFADKTNDIRIMYPEYVEKVFQAREKYKDQIEILFGVEIDWLEGYEDWISKEVKKYPFDYVIGSVHYIAGYPIDYTDRWFKELVNKSGGIKKVVSKYYQEIRNVIASNFFDGLGHLDRIKRYSVDIYFREDEDWYREEIDKTLGILQKSRMVMEINTSGLTKPFASTYPSPWILKEAKKRDIKIIIGSDAHTPENVGKDLDRAVELAKSVGYQKLVRFEKRKKTEVII